MNILEAMEHVATLAKKYKMSMQELDDAIYYYMRDHYKEKPPTFFEYLENPIYVPEANDILYPVWRESFKKIYPSVFYNPYYLILLYACTGAGKCQSGEVLLSTNKGILKLKEIVDRVNQGEELYTYSEDGINRILKGYNNGIKSTNYIETESGRVLEITDEHRLRVITQEGIVWKLGKELKSGDLLIQHSKNHILIDKNKATNAFAYSLGYLTGEGTNSISSTQLFTQNTYRKFKNLLGFIKKFPLYKGIHRIICPWVYTRGTQDISDYILGLKASRGYIKGNYTVIKIEDLDFLKQIQELLSFLGVPSFINKDSSEILFNLKAVNTSTVSIIKAYNLNSQTEDYVIRNNVILDPINTIVKSKTHVFDITVDKSHSYLVNGIVNHNSTILTLIAGYELVKLLCLKNPLKTYNLGTSDIIYLDFHMPTQKLGTQTNFAKFINMLNSSPYFLKEINIPSISSGFGLLTKNIALELITCAEDTVSKAVFFVGMDEFNEKKHSNVQNESIYTYLDRRMEGRFMNAYGFVPYKFVVASSPKDSSDELSKLTEKLEKLSETGNRRAYKTGNIPQWLTRGVNIQYSGKKFRVYLGDEYTEPFILEDDKPTPDFIDLEKLKYVPVEYLRSFQQDIIGSIQDILGISTNLSGRLYASRKYIDTAYSQDNLFASDTFSLPFDIGFEEGVKLMLGYFNFNKIKFPEYSRAIHVDVGLTGDRLAISSCYSVPSTYLTGSDGIFKDNMFMSDFVVGIDSYNKEQIPLDVIAGFIAEIDKRGYPVGIVTYDGFQSASLCQPLSRKKIENKLLSLDRTKDPYLTHKRAIIAGRYLAPNNTICKDELINLRNLPNKIDHPADGSKDLSDASTGAFFSCFMNEDILNKNRRIIKALHGNQTNTLKQRLAKSGFGYYS